MGKKLTNLFLTLVALFCFASANAQDVSDPQVILDEHFDAFTEGSADAPASTKDISGYSGKLKTELGWTSGRYVYEAGGSLMVGDGGNLQTSYLNLSSNGGTVRITVDIKMRDSYGGGVKVSMGYSTNETKYCTDSEWHTYSFIFSGGSSSSYIKVEPVMCASGILIDNLKVETGTGFVAAPKVAQPDKASKTEFTAKWYGVTGATGYLLDVYSKNGSEKEYLLKDQAVTGRYTSAYSANTYDVTGLDETKTYFYTMRTVKGENVSEESEEIEVIPIITSIDTPVATEATDVTAAGFTANWEAVANASGYSVKVTRNSVLAEDGDVSILSEDFSGVTAGTLTSVSYPSMRESLDAYTSTKGWEGYMHCLAAGYMGISTYGSAGTITTPKLDLSANEGKFTLKMTAGANYYGTMKADECKVIVIDKDGNQKENTIALEAAFKEYVLELTGDEATAIQISYSGSNKFFIDEMSIVQTLKAGSVKSDVVDLSDVGNVTSKAYELPLDENTSYEYQVAAYVHTIVSGEPGDVYSPYSEAIKVEAPASDEDEVFYGTFADPIAIAEGNTYGLNANVNGGKFNYYTFESGEDVKITLTTTPGTNPGGGFGISTGNFLFDDKENYLEGVVMLGEDDITTEMVPVGDGIGNEGGEDDFGVGFGNFVISTSWNAKAGEVYFIMCQGVGTFTVALSEADTTEKVGTTTNPINLNEHPTWTWGVDGKVPGSATHYTYTAEKDGNLTISNCNEDIYVGEDGWYDPFTNTGGPAYTGEIEKTTDWAAYTATHTFAVEEGVTYCITIFDLIKGNDGEVIKAEFTEAAPADETATIFKWANVTGSDEYVAEAGTIECLGGDKNDRLNYANAALGVNYKTICLNGKKGNLGDGSTNGTYMKVTPTQALKAGDVIAMTAYRNKDAMGKKATAALVFDNGASDAVIGANPEFPNLNAAGENPTGAPETIELVVTEEMAGAKSINLTRQDASTNLFITSLIITSESIDEVVPVESVSIVDPDNTILDNATYTLKQGETLQLTAVITPENATNKNVTWEVMQEADVITFEDGIVTAVGEGKAAVVVTTEDGEKQAFVYIYVPAPEPVKEPTTFEITNEGLDVTITPSNDNEYSYAIVIPEIVEALGKTDRNELFDDLANMFFNVVSGEVTFDVLEDYLEYAGLEELAPGTEVEVLVSNVKKEDGEIVREGEITTYTFTYGEGGEPQFPIGTYAEPIALEEGKTYGLNFMDTEKPNYYTFESDKDVKVILTPAEGAMAMFGVTTGNFWYDPDFNDLEGAEDVMVVEEPVESDNAGTDDDEFGGDFGWGMGPGRMATTWNAKAGVKYYIVAQGQGSFDVALGEPEEYVGTVETPINLNETPEWTWGTDGKLPGNTTYYTYTAEKDGNLTIFVSNCSENQLYVGEGGWYDSYVHTEGPAYTGEINTEYNWGAWTETNTFAVEAGTTYFITIFDLYDETIKATFEEATGIKGATADKANGTIFNVGGQKVDKTAKGILIINGKKVLKK